MPRRERVRLLLRGLAKLLAVVLVAGAAGVLLGIGLSKLTGDDEASAPAVAPSTTTSTRAATAPSQTTSVRAAALAKVRVRVFGAVLHAAPTASGAQRQRARLAVRVRVQNTGTATVTLPRPTLTAAGVSVKADAGGDTPTTDFGPLAPGEARTMTLRFETAGALTTELTSTHRGQLRIAGRTAPPLFVTVGAALRGSAQ